MKIRSVEKTDSLYLEKFLAEAFPKTSAEKWRLLFRVFWEENPAYHPGMPRGWILEDNQNRIRGFIGNIPFRFLVAGKKGMAAASAGWFVQPAFRGIHSLKLLKAFSNQENIDILLSTTPNDIVKNILIKLGFRHLPLPFNQTEYWLILNLEKAFVPAIKNRYPSSPTWLLNILAMMVYPLKPVFSSGLSHHWSWGKLGNSEYDFSICHNCDESFTEFWEENRKHFSSTLYRDAETLNWLYFSPLVVQKRIVVQCTSRDSQKLAGYFVYDLLSVAGSQAKMMQLKDFVIPGLSSSFLREFLSFSMQLAEESGAAAVRIWPVNEKMSQLLAKRIKIKRKFGWPYLAKWKAGLEDDASCLGSTKFFPSPIDPDRGFS
jgi:hypothetical protein